MNKWTRRVLGICLILGIWAVASVGQDLPRSGQILIVPAVALFALFAGGAMWRDIARWDISTGSKILWMLSSLSGLGFVLWAMTSSSEQKRRLSRTSSRDVT